jgi:hypothetical protein
MALGFQDCCNSASYFYLNGIPATVSEFETYYIITSQGENFCASYVDVPALNYRPPTYNLLQMTEYNDCDDCKTSNSYTCPTSESILINQVGAGSVAVSDCRIVTIMQLDVECLSVNPTVAGGTNGSVSLYVSGGTPPYFFFSAGTSNALGVNQSENNIFPIFDNLPEGTYNIDITDSTNDFIITTSCVLDNAPPELVVSCVSVPATRNGASNGSINLNVAGGIPPYTFTYLGSNVTLPLSNLVGGYYTITVTDSGTGGDLQTTTIICNVSEPPPITYPEYLCLKFTICSTVFTLEFERDETDINLHASYSCFNPQFFGLSNLTLFYGDNGWTTSTETIIFPIFFNAPCGVSYEGQIFSLRSVTNTSNQPSGAWTANSGALVGVTPIVVTDGLCVPVAVFISAQPYCTLTPDILAGVVVAANGGLPPYSWNVYNNFLNQVNNDFVFYLPGGSYTLVVTDSLGQQSDPVSFTVETVNGVDVLFGLEPCGNFTYLTQNISGTNDGSPQIVAGEMIQLGSSIYSFSDFSYLPNGSQFTGRIKISLFSIFQSGQGDNQPSSNNIVLNPIFTQTNLNTNGVSTNFLTNITRQDVSLPYPSFNGTNGTWYNYAQGSLCCPNPSQEGLKWQQGVIWRSNTLTFNNTSSITLNLSLTMINKVPYFQGGCSGGFCGAVFTSRLTVFLEDLQVVDACLGTNGFKKILDINLRNNSDGIAGPFSDIVPSTQCPF